MVHRRLAAARQARGKRGGRQPVTTKQVLTVEVIDADWASGSTADPNEVADYRILSRRRVQYVDR